jgi:FecR protein
MKTISGISTAAFLALMIVGLSSQAQEAVGSASPSSNDASPTASSETANTTSGNSKVRIVRLSEVKGEVQLDRNAGRGFESAMANLPVTEGAKLKTGNGVAEVEFEDNSTVRVGQNSLVEFPRLELLPSGAKSSAVKVLQGMVYVNLMNTKGNEFTVAFGQEKLSLPPDCHVRLQLAPSEANLAVFHGEAVVEDPSGSTAVGKNKTMTFNLASQSPPVIAKSVVQEPLDSWDNDAVQYHKSYANASSFGNSPYAYGINDMNYYGSFVNAGGCGSMWRPYFTSASWDPFGNGAWAYYPSAGYSWVSPYPWGWTPYHSGSWAFCQGLGWGWQPGGAWMGLANNSFVRAGPTSPRPPSRPPLAGESALVPVNHQPLAASGLAGHDTFVFRKDSAGLGVPRGSLGKLNSYSGEAVQHGMASTNVFYSGQRGGAEGEGRIQPAGSASSAASYSNSVSNTSMSAPSASRGSSGSTGGGSGHH